MSIIEGALKSIAHIGRKTTMILFLAQSPTSASAIATSTVVLATFAVRGVLSMKQVEIMWFQQH